MRAPSKSLPPFCRTSPSRRTELADTVLKHLLALAAMSKDGQIIKLLLEDGPNLSALKNIDTDNDPLKIAIRTKEDERTKGEDLLFIASLSNLLYLPAAIRTPGFCSLSKTR
jgi:hypothetical protein